MISTRKCRYYFNNITRTMIIINDGTHDAYVYDHCHNELALYNIAVRVYILFNRSKLFYKKTVDKDNTLDKYILNKYLCYE